MLNVFSAHLTDITGLVLWVGVFIHVHRLMVAVIFSDSLTYGRESLASVKENSFRSGVQFRNKHKRILACIHHQPFLPTTTPLGVGLLTP